METATASGKRNVGLYHSNAVAAFDRSELRAATAARITDCVVRAFRAIGASSQTQEIVFWNLFIIKDVERNDIMDKPEEFIEGLRGIYGEAGTAVFETMLKREIKREFDLPAVPDKEDGEERSSSDLIRAIKIAALESMSDRQD